MPVHTRRDARGAALIEFALLLPVFSMLLFGMITAGLALNDKQQMTHATREGGRYAATVDPLQDFSNGASWATNVRDLIVERSTGVLESADICVSLVEGSDASLTVHDESGADPAKNTAWFTSDPSGEPCIPGQAYPVSSSDDGLRVQITARQPAQIDLILFGQFTVTMSSTATARSEGQ